MNEMELADVTPRQQPAKEITIFEVKNGYIVKQGQACSTSEFLVFRTMDELLMWVKSGWGDE